jgi:hypothetical protein
MSMRPIASALLATTAALFSPGASCAGGTEPASAAAAAAAAAPVARALQALKAPENAVSLPWPGVADRTLVAWTTWRADENTTADAPEDGAIDLDLAIVQSSTGAVLQHTHQSNAWTSDADHFDGFSIDTANYAIAPGRRAFGIRVRSHHQGCAGSQGEALRLFEARGAGLAPLTRDDIVMKESVTWCDCSESREVTRTLAVAPTTTRGHADLVLRERRVEGTGKETQDRGRCEMHETRTSARALLRFDGDHYTGSEAMR